MPRFNGKVPSVRIKCCRRDLYTWRSVIRSSDTEGQRKIRSRSSAEQTLEPYPVQPSRNRPRLGSHCSGVFPVEQYGRARAGHEQALPTRREAGEPRIGRPHWPDKNQHGWGALSRRPHWPSNGQHGWGALGRRPHRPSDQESAELEEPVRTERGNLGKAQQTGAKQERPRRQVGQVEAGMHERTRSCGHKAYHE